MCTLLARVVLYRSGTVLLIKEQTEKERGFGIDSQPGFVLLPVLNVRKCHLLLKCISLTDAENKCDIFSVTFECSNLY